MTGSDDQTTTQSTDRRRARPAPVPDPPHGKEKLRYIGPGVLWALAALATGELLFTPRVGAQYGYALLWALVVALALKLFTTREIGRFTVVTGDRLLTGFARLPGPRGWAVWVILVPQLVVGVASLAGIASAAGSALVIALPGPVQLWTGVILAVAAALVLWGRYTGVEWVGRILGLLLALGTLAAAVLVFPDLGEAARGLIPTIPEDLVVSDILPWLGFLSNGAAGLMWYSYWISAKGNGVAGIEDGRRPRPLHLGDDDTARVKSWLRTMTLDSTFAVVGTGLVTIAFLVLGAELLRPRGIVPDESDVARDLTNLFSDVYGQIGFWFMVLALISAFWTATLTNQDGWQRLYTDGARRLMSRRLSERRWTQPKVLSRTAIIVWLTLLPFVLFLAFGNPVTLLTIGGSIEAVHIPVVAALVLWMNHRELPPALRAGKIATGIVLLTILFFTFFAGFYLWQQFFG